MSVDIEKDAYCKNCGYICDSRVTFAETCDDCHIPIEYHNASEQTLIEQQQAEIERRDVFISRLIEQLKVNDPLNEMIHKAELLEQSE